MQQVPVFLSKQRNHSAGFTLIELLIVMGLVGFLLGITVYGFVRQASSAKAVQYIEGLAQDINLARSMAMSKGQRIQVLFNSVSGAAGSSYTLINLDAPPPNPAPTPQVSKDITLTGVAAGDNLICSTTGFCLGQNSAGATKVISTITATAGATTRTMDITVLGLTRVQ